MKQNNSIVVEPLGVRSFYQQLRNRSLQLLLDFFSKNALKQSEQQSLDVLLYTIDVVQGRGRFDPRIAVVYQALAECRAIFLELVHARSLKQALYNWIKRRRKVVYLSSLRDASGDVAACTTILQRLSPKIVLGVDDHRHTASLVIAAKALGIPTVAVQHGCYSAAQMFVGGRDVHFDHYIVWSEFFAQRLQKLAPQYRPEQFLICPHRALNSALRQPVQRKPRVLLVSEMFADASLMQAVAGALCASGVCDVFFRLRPGERARESIFSRYLTPHNCCLNEDLFADLSCADVVVGSYSSVLYEALLVGAGVVVCGEGRRACDLLELEVAIAAPQAAAVVDAVFVAAQLSLSERHHRRAVVWGEALAGAPRLSDLLRTCGLTAAIDSPEVRHQDQQERYANNAHNS